ncbi:MAG: vWA domain-containing protein [Myxococcota bacterium]
MGRAFAAAFIVITSSGCQGEPRVSPIPATDTAAGTPVEERIVQATAPEADVLFVIDNSGSMEDDQTALAEELPRFVQTLEAWGVDYHVGVTTTDTESEATRGRLVTADGARFVTPDLPDPVDTLSEMIRVGTEGAAAERGLLATYLALTTYRNRDENRGFVRPDVPLSTIVVSDEDDETDTEITVEEFVDWYAGLREPADRTFSAVVALQSIGQSQRGRRYLQVAGDVGGVVQDIDAGQWAHALEALGLRTAGLRQDYVLGQIPDPDTLEVDLERGEDVIEVAGVRYEPDRNAVVLDVRPEPSDVVVIRYRTLR